MASPILDPIIAQVEKLTTVTASIKLAFSLLQAKIATAPTLSDAQAIAAEFDLRSTELAEAAIANTPAE